MSQSYSDVVIQHFRRPNNKGRLAGANAAAEGANPLCGDRLRIECLVSGARVVSAMFTGDACAICVAAASMLTEQVKGLPVPDVMALPDETLFARLGGGVPAARRRCGTLPLETMRHALQPFVAVSIVRPIVLAAGAGRRFGGDKLLAELDGEPLIRGVVAAYAELCGRVTVVIADDPRLRQALHELPVDIVVNRMADEGIASSIRAGVGACADRPAVMIALGDEPRVDRELVAAVMRLWHDHPAAIVAPRYNGEIGHPVLFDRSVYADLLALDGDRGARGLITALASQARFLDVVRARPADVDTPEDLDQIRGSSPNGSDPI